MVALQRSLDCTATLVTENHDQARAQVRHCVLDAAQRMVVDQIPSRANDEKVTQVLIEDQLGRSAGIGASENDGERVLFLGCLCPTCCSRFALGDLTRSKSEIALLKFGQRGISADRGSRMFGSQDQSDDARTGYSGKDADCASPALFLFVPALNFYQNQ